MAEKGGKMAVSEHPNPPNPFFLLFQNLVNNLPLPKFQAKQRVADSGQEEQGEGEGEGGGGGGGGEVISKKFDLVRFSETRPVIPPPLKLEAEESDNRSSPTVLWQVYALGGFIILKWAWARWNERKNKKGASDEEPTVAED